jgi:hypothetical protein
MVIYICTTVCGMCICYSSAGSNPIANPSGLWSTSSDVYIYPGPVLGPASIIGTQGGFIHVDGDARVYEGANLDSRRKP